MEGKVVYGYQVHAAIVSAGQTALCYSLRRYSKEGKTKVEMTLDVLKSLPDQAGAYVLMDSWYTNPAILEECEKKDCHLIGATKTNRTLYPNGQRTSAMDYACSLSPSHFHLVTVKGRTYWVHRYEGPLNKIHNAVVLLSYPKEAFGNPKALRIFLCSDLSLDDRTILEYYSHRWKIEMMFRSQKRYMGFKSFMVRAAKAFDRLLTILCLAQFFFTCGLDSYLPFEASIRSCRASLCTF
ncbi:transposase [uncultured Dysosmobacter sp.]|uniref:transposase n=1 Tax=uncultured Dysosmobacter sp. TaxID=2591384 RepID=UPI002606348B|nr:transposase [uncultured Dysosmobacter sp.]